ncbi:MAG: hypothetical protein OEX04_13720 [Acidimicrobiia bacterium]|nr:hypothetical protein [Acidimicrobiia bacterium]
MNAKSNLACHTTPPFSLCGQIDVVVDGDGDTKGGFELGPQGELAEPGDVECQVHVIGIRFEDSGGGERRDGHLSPVLAGFGHELPREPVDLAEDSLSATAVRGLDALGDDLAVEVGDRDPELGAAEVDPGDQPRSSFDRIHRRGAAHSAGGLAFLTDDPVLDELGDQGVHGRFGEFGPLCDLDARRRTVLEDVFEHSLGVDPADERVAIGIGHREAIC